ncbi:hypothetical protein [Nocardia cyriacigeorgica]|uniref:Protein RecA n=1 Tax=Nocardia cyriacigeorgica TaxID=135487 RepID=A0A4V6ICY7_9NOCA|nr:hypothetical protein [Nocardia cyriacigeorgica]MBF6319775.1 hypothetical protein [Nocardia cyriacigeorgica]MBF6533472.1 hypothetical protein [Nocardia cyriacigeorgica]VFB01454.1 Uncharacterised protein [Nocardia cyriacigeorgica]
MGSDSREPGRATAQELAELRRKIAAVPGRGESAAARLPTSEGVRRQTLPVPSALAELLPDGGLVTGSVVAYAGAGSLLAGLLAAVTAGGGHAAVVGMPKLGLLAAAEMGAQLGRIAVVADPGPDALEVAAVLLDGLDLVLLDLGGVAVAPARAKVIAARARNKGAVLVVTGGRWPAPTLRLGTRVAAYTGLGLGRGRLDSISLDVEVASRSSVPRTGGITLRQHEGRMEWMPRETLAATGEPGDVRDAAS